LNPRKSRGSDTTIFSSTRRVAAAAGSVGKKRSRRPRGANCFSESIASTREKYSSRSSSPIAKRIMFSGW